MKNYERIMQDMTPSRMAEVNVKLVTVNNTNLFYMTSSGQLFNTNDYENAVRYEYNWLMTDPDPKTAEPVGEPDSCCECNESCDCEQTDAKA